MNITLDLNCIFYRNTSGQHEQVALWKQNLGVDHRRNLFHQNFPEISPAPAHEGLHKCTTPTRGENISSQHEQVPLRKGNLAANHSISPNFPRNFSWPWPWKAYTSAMSPRGMKMPLKAIFY